MGCATILQKKKKNASKYSLDMYNSALNKHQTLKD